MLVDIHTHRFNKSEFPSIINLSFQEAKSILASLENGLFSIGIHPWNVHEFSEKEMTALHDLTSDKRIVAIGECGLDKNSKTSLPTQIQFFSNQIEISEKYQKPLIIHCVGCFNELFELRKKLKPTQVWIIHGFRGKPELAVQALKSGCSISFGEHFNEESVQLTPINKLFVETDESNLSIEKIYSNIAKIKNCLPELLTAGEDFYTRITCFV